MMIRFLFFWLLYTLAMADISSPLSPSTNVSNPSLSVPLGVNCATRSVDERANVHAIDCLNLFTFILATTHHTAPMTFTLTPAQLPGAKVFSRTAGTCEFFVVLGNGRRPVRPPAETFSLDVVLGIGLGIVAYCLLDGQPEYTHWAGVAKVSAVSKLRIGVAGLLSVEGNSGSGNGSIELGAGMEGWLDEVSES